MQRGPAPQPPPSTPDRLGAHTERLRERLNACVLAAANIPELAQRQVVRELSSISKATVYREKAIQTVDQALHKLPRQLGQLEELVASISVRASARITAPLARLEAATCGTQLLLLRAPSLQPEPLPVSQLPRGGSTSAGVKAGQSGTQHQRHG